MTVGRFGVGVLWAGLVLDLRSINAHAHMVARTTVDNRAYVSVLTPTPDGLAAFDIKLDRVIGKELAGVLSQALQGAPDSLVPTSSGILEQHLEI